MLKNFGYVRVGAVVPKIKIANPIYNAEEIVNQIKIANKKGVQIVLFPELSLTGYSCQDLFYNYELLKKSLDGLETIVNKTKALDIITVIGMPLLDNNILYNVAVVISRGKIIGIVPKVLLCNDDTINEERWFSSGKGVDKFITLLNQQVKFSHNIVFKDNENQNISFKIKIGDSFLEDNFSNSSTLVLNLAASTAMVGKEDVIRKNVSAISNIYKLGYIYVSSGINETTTDSVFYGKTLICEEGKVLVENRVFDFESNIIYTDIDVNKIVNHRIKKGKNNYQDDNIVYVDIKDINVETVRKYLQYPFVGDNADEIKRSCEEIYNIQVAGVARRLMHLNMKKTVIGISGGLDSTLAFLVILGAYRKLGIDPLNIIAVTMPGFGTTPRTYNNAIDLIKSFGATLREIDIKASCMQHFKDINHDINIHDVTYENAQARERTQILMDIANKENAIVIGTGDLSELALGWCTYNGDHMSMYSVNSSVPKTLIKYIIDWYSTIVDDKQRNILNEITATPISPELLPPDKKGNIKQKTEDVLGPYILHDYFLYHFLNNGDTVTKIYVHAVKTFDGIYSKDEIKKYLKVFIKRFFTNQFKRNCMPEGPRVGVVDLGSRNSFRTPSDVDLKIWIDELEKL